MSRSNRYPWSYRQGSKPASPTTDPRFRAFVQQLNDEGASDYTIAAALAHSEWANGLGNRSWHWTQMPALRAALGCTKPLLRRESAQEDLALARDRRSRLSAALECYDPAAVQRIRQLEATGWSPCSIAAILNRSRTECRRGRRWSMRSVRQVEQLIQWANQL